jgi:hypothetical protein
VCPDFVGPGRLVGQLRAVVLRFWDTPGGSAPSGACRGAAGRDPFRPFAAPSCALRLHSGEGVPMATAIISGGRAFRTATPVFSIPPWSLCVGGTFAPNRCPDGNGHRFGRKSLQSATPVSSIPQWSRLKPLLPMEIGLPGRSRAGRRPPPTHKPPSRSAQAFTPIGNRPSKALARQASASADARDASPVGAGRPPAEGPGRPNSFGTQAERWLKAFVPIEIGLLRRCAPGVGLRRRKRYLPVGAGRPSAAGPSRPNSFGAQADRRPKAFTPIEIGPLRRSAPRVGPRRRR